jgi:5-methyltetrahydrofolate--homocysteine methyltransferase
METILKGTGSSVHIAPDRPTVLIGERINPTGRKKLAAELVAGNVEVVKAEALAQVAAGADVIDVNVGAVGVDQVTLLPRAVEMVQEAVDVPLSIDTPDPAALAAALKVYQGKPLVNSVNGEEKNLSRVLPLVAEHGAVVIGLCMDDKGIPGDPSKRLDIARKIIERAEDLGIPREDVLIDCLALTVGADSKAALVTRRRLQSRAGHTGDHSPDQDRTGRQHDAGGQQRLLWPAGPRGAELGFPGHSHPGGRQRSHRQRGPGQTGHPGSGRAPGAGRVRDEVYQGLPQEAEEVDW